MKKLMLIILAVFLTGGVIVSCKKNQQTRATDRQSETVQKKKVPLENSTAINVRKPIEIIHCTGNLRRPKALNCDNDNIPERCECGFGVCNFHCTILGWEVFRSTEGLPIDQSLLDQDQAVVFKSADGKYLLYKFIHLTGDDRQKSKPNFLVDEEYQYTCITDTKVMPQVATTYYKENSETGITYLKSLAGSETSFFGGLTFDEIHLENAPAFALVKL